MNKLLYLSILLVLFLSCKNEGKKISIKTLFTAKVSNTDLLNKEGKTIATRFNTPLAYKRVQTNQNSFAYYLQKFSFKTPQEQSLSL